MYIETSQFRVSEEWISMEKKTKIKDGMTDEFLFHSNGGVHFCCKVVDCDSILGRDF